MLDVRRSPTARLVTATACALLAACAGAARDGDLPVSDAGSVFRIATWNVHDLFDAVDRTAPPGDEDLVPSMGEVDAKIARLGRVLARIDADLFVLEEVETLEILERLAAGSLAGGNYRAFLREGYDPRGIDVGVLSRVPFVTGPSHLDERGADGRRLWSRDVAEIHLGGGVRGLVILGAHLVSRLDPADDGQRLLQATRLRDIADAIRAGGSGPGVLVVGDMNDVPTSPTLAPLLGGFGCADLGASVPASLGWTWSGGGAHERIDYALLCGADQVAVTRVEVVAGADVSAASDHRPLVVDVWLDPGAR